MNDEPQDYSQPVAYDVNGRPLYAHPPAAANPPVQPSPQQPAQASHVTQAPLQHDGHNFDPATRIQHSNEPSVIHTSREHHPEVPDVSAALQQKHEESKRRYPNLNLSEGEYVILAVRRHPIGIIFHVVTTLLGMMLVFGLAFVFAHMIQTGYQGNNLVGTGDVMVIALLVSLLVGVFGYIVTWVYIQNKFFMTNESIIQEIHHALFAKHEQTVSLGSIEDASFKQTNIIEHLFNYGRIRLSTEGEETTYRFHFVSDPKAQIARINNAVEAFKNGRPVTDD